MIRFRKFLSILISILIVVSMSVALMPGASADIPEEEDIEAYVNDDPITSKAAIVIDFTTGLVIFEHNVDELRVPASMTKMLAVFVILDAIKAGYISIEAYIQPSRATSAFSFNRYYSNVPMPSHLFFSIRELLAAVIVRSACAATVALGEGVFGSEEELVRRMNEKIKQLGIDGIFYDSWGGSSNNMISARGMAELTRALIEEHPETLEFTSMQTILFNEIEYNNTNLLLDNYLGADGFKTGFTTPAGWCFTGTALVDGRRMISVTMGSLQGFRFYDSAILLDYGFANFDDTVANHFRNSLKALDSVHAARSPLIPISMYKIEETRFFSFRYLALLLNDTNTLLAS